VIELYDYGENVEIVRSLAPNTILLSTFSGTGPGGQHRVWRAMLRGGRGLILWDPNHGFVRPDGTLGPRATTFAALFRKLRSGLGALIIGSRRHIDPVAMLYSPASFRTQWMLDVKPAGEAWSTRDADSKYADNAVRAARRAFSRAIALLGLQHRFLSPEQLVDGTLGRQRDRVLVLPHAIALSAAEAGAIRRFVAAGGIVVADAVPGVFDEHSRRSKKSPLADLFPRGVGVFAFGKGKTIRVATVGRSKRDVASALATIFADAGIAPPFPLTLPNRSQPGDVETYVFRNGSATVVALQRERTKANQGTNESLILTVPPGSYVTDLVAEKPLGRRDRLEIALGTVAPAMFAVSPRAHSPPRISVPAELWLGDTAKIRIRRTGSGTAFRLLHVEVLDPLGRAVPRYSGNVPLMGEAAEWPLALGPDDLAGNWRVRVADILAGATQTFGISVSAR
jgi:hypothetical protein